MCVKCRGWCKGRRWELHLKEDDALFDGSPANGTADNLVAAHLARSMAAQEHHVLFAVKAYGADGLEQSDGGLGLFLSILSVNYLFFNFLQFLLQFLNIV